MLPETETLLINKWLKYLQWSESQLPDNGRNKDKVALGQGWFSRARLGGVEEQAERNGWPEKRGFAAP